MALDLHDDPGPGANLPPPTAAIPDRNHNHPPEPVDVTAILREDLDLDRLRERITLMWAEPLGERRAALIASFERFSAGVSSIRDDDTQAKAALLVRQMRAHAALADTHHDVVKAPVLAAGRLIDAIWHGIVDDLLANATTVNKMMTEYSQWQRAEAKRRANEEAAARRAEADRLAAEAAEIAKRAGPVVAAENVSSAVHAHEMADQAERAAARVDVAAATRVRGDGVVASLGGTWRHEVTDMKALLQAVIDEKVPLEAITVNTKWLDFKLKDIPQIKKAGAQPVPGVRFFLDEKVNVR